MTCQHSLLFLFLSGFAALYVAEICKTNLLEGTSCTFELPTKNTDKSNEIKWVHLSGDAVIHRKNRWMRKNIPGLKMEEDGSLTFESVSLKNSGRYTYTVFNKEGTQIDAGEKEIKVYANAPKPTVKINCTFGNATLTCDFGDRTDLTVSWYKEDNIIQYENNPKLLLTSAQVQENKLYSCIVSNPVSKEQSDSITVSCEGVPDPTGESVPGPRKNLFGPDFWVMVSILAGGGTLLLLLICILIICACRSCSQLKKAQTR
ncbi:hepatocyte cell adhesion molecule-like isoform X1 [Carassius auratus]|uniref:Hepatocyte cell adhesion molecule-like isoform X1 n=1 Tax=Carassius auratus TaxID=7957 RepID=A0A6P6PI21_CARAU|nr:hepatocyte cell adhesion molecule-like isoform X1 [Carassius auratus]